MIKMIIFFSNYNLSVWKKKVTETRISLILRLIIAFDITLDHLTTDVSFSVSRLLRRVFLACFIFYFHAYIVLNYLCEMILNAPSWVVQRKQKDREKNIYGELCLFFVIMRFPLTMP